jgi:hypothetical protein
MSKEAWGDEGHKDEYRGDGLSPLQVTEMLFRMPPTFTSGLVMNRPARNLSRAGRLFQARMWRNYASEWGLPDWHPRRRWVEFVLRKSRVECIRRAKVNLYLARRHGRKVP